MCRNDDRAWLRGAQMLTLMLARLVTDLPSILANNTRSLIARVTEFVFGGIKARYRSGNISCL